MIKKIIYISVILIVFTFSSCKNDTNSADNKTVKDSVEVIIDLETSEQISELCLSINANISKNLYQMQEFNTLCQNTEIEAYLTKYLNSENEIIKIEIALNNTKMFEIVEYYFYQNKLIEKYDYIEIYENKNATAEEYIVYFKNELIFNKTIQQGSGINIEKAYQQFESMEPEIIKSKEDESKIINEESILLAKVSSNEELNSYYCKK